MAKERFRPASEVQTGNAVEPRQRFLRIASMEVDHLGFLACHYCLRPQRPLPCWQFDSNCFSNCQKRASRPTLHSLTPGRAPEPRQIVTGPLSDAFCHLLAHASVVPLSLTRQPVRQANAKLSLALRLHALQPLAQCRIPRLIELSG